MTVFSDMMPLPIPIASAWFAPLWSPRNQNLGDIRLRPFKSPATAYHNAGMASMCFIKNTMVLAPRSYPLPYANRSEREKDNLSRASLAWIASQGVSKEQNPRIAKSNAAFLAALWIKDEHQTIIKPQVFPFLIGWSNLKPSETIWNISKNQCQPCCFLHPTLLPAVFAPSLPFTARAGDESRVSCPAAGVNSNRGVLCQDLNDKAQYLEIIVSTSGKLAELHSYLVKPWKIIHSVRWSCPTHISKIVILGQINRRYWMIQTSSHRKNVYQPCGYESKPSYPGKPQNFVKQVSTPIPIWTYSWKLLEYVRIISYDFIYLILFDIIW